MFSDDSPPAYDFDDSLPSPTYSTHVGITERLLQLELPGMTGCPGCDWIIESKHMKINLGSRMWGLNAPAYGLNSTIDGSVQLLGDLERVESITITLEGSLKIALGHRGVFSGDNALPIISQTIKVDNSPDERDHQHLFSIPIPPEVEIGGRLTPTPPSFFAIHQHVACEVSYELRFRMTRKGKGLRRSESKNIRIFYLPKTRPSDPPIAAIPRPPRQMSDPSLLLRMFDRVKTVTLTPYEPSLQRSRPGALELESYRNAVHLTLPNPLCFTSGELIPFTLCLAFPQHPALANLLMHNTRVHLLRRLRITRKGLPETVQRDILVASSHARHAKEYDEGINVLRGTIEAGYAGGESSWKIHDVSLEYVLRVTLRPPNYLSGHIPSFRHDEVVEIRTDHWGTLARELSSIGTSPPALGLAKGLRHDT